MKTLTAQDTFTENNRQRKELHKFLEDLKTVQNVDMRWVAIAKTHFQEGLSAARRATYLQPEDSL